MTFIADIKAKVMHAVESSYEFDTSQAPESIGRNARRAQALLIDLAFVYKVSLIASPFFCQLKIAMWVTGTQRWWTSSTISTPRYPESYQYHVVQEQGRRRDCLLESLLTPPDRSYWPCTHGGEDRIHLTLDIDELYSLS